MIRTVLSPMPSFMIQIVILCSLLNKACHVTDKNNVMKNQQIHQYQTVIDFEPNKELRFPDFTLVHTQHKKVQGPNNAKWKRQTFYFLVTGKQDTLEISWSTGLIRNTKFTVDGTAYELIMGSYRDPDSETKSFKNIPLHQLMIIKSEKVELSKEKQHR